MAKITNKMIDGEIATFTTNRNVLRDHAVKIAMMIFLHAAPKEVSTDADGTGDCTRAVKLVRAMPNSWGGQMIDWFKAFTPIRIKLSDKGTDKCEYDPAYKKLSPAEKKAQAFDWWQIVEANATPFYEVRPEEPAQKDYDFKALVEMVARLSKTIDKKIEDGKVPEADIMSAKAISAAVAGLKFERVKDKAPANDPTPAEEVQKNTARAPRVRKAA